MIVQVRNRLHARHVLYHLGNSVYAEEDVALLVQLLEPVAFSSFMLLYGVCYRRGIKSTEVQ